MNSELFSTKDTSLFSGQPIVVFDLECTAWEGSVERGWKREDEIAEIIQIGAVEIFSNAGQWEMEREFNQYVKPNFRPELSDYIINLTGITQEMIDNLGVSFPVALRSFFEFAPEDAQLCVNGDDWTFLESNCRMHSIDNPFREGRIINVRPYIARQLGLDEGNNDLHSHRLARIINTLNSEPYNALVEARSIAQALIYMTDAL